jgi:hypothetical protein
MDRRELLRAASLVAGYSAIASVMPGCKTETSAPVAEATDEWKPGFLDQDQLDLVAELAETLIPETSTPGAKSVKVHQFIDDELKYFYRPMDQYRFVKGLEDVQARAQAAHGKKFQEITAEERTALLQQLETETKKMVDEKTAGPGQPFFTMLKNMTFQGYFTSEKVGKEVLAFDPIPGDFKGCIPLSEVGKLWTVD